MEYDVVIVGGGPSGLSTAIKLKQLKSDLNVCVLEKASEMIVSICGGEITNLDIQLTKKPDVKRILFDPNLASKTIGIKKL